MFDANARHSCGVHKHLMPLVKSEREGYCCGIKFGGISDGYYCDLCDLFFHKICSTAPTEVGYSSHKCDKSLSLSSLFWVRRRCDLCGEKFKLNTMNYGCRDCYIALHLYCAENPPPEVIEVPQNHDHQLNLETRRSRFNCAACGKDGVGYPYKCHECQLTFHVACERREAEVNHLSHSKHPLKLVKAEPPTYTGGTCRLCGDSLGNYEVYYHCSSCKFSLDLKCVVNPTPMSVRNRNTHEHRLTLMPKSISFTCTLCGLDGDRSPYVCLPCDFTAHNDCYGFPWVININRHEHRVSRNSNIGLVDAVCGVCRKKMDWSCGGYSCERCQDSVYHTKCATRDDVSDGIEMKDEPEEDKATEPFEVIDENTIHHFCHDIENEEHYLRLDKSGIFIEERSCEACVYPIYHDFFYSCMTCNYMLHERCANLPRRKRHVVSCQPYYLSNYIGSGDCTACGVHHNGFYYSTGEAGLDMWCASVTEPFVHQSHPHPLFYTSPKGVCSACKKYASHVLRCVEDKCGYILDFKCALLPYEVKHRVDDHFLSLCYGEDSKKARGKYWCDICEKETDPQTWFYTCKDCGVTLHIDCVLGDSRGLRPGSEVSTSHHRIWKGYEVVRNNSMSRPLCTKCKSRCILPVILKLPTKNSIIEYYCSINCTGIKYKD